MHEIPQKVRNIRRVADVYLLCGAIFLIATLVGDIQAGGHPWRQGDWLIHNEAGPIRRGLFGSALMEISDFLSLPILTTLCLLQSILVAIAFWSFRSLIYLIEQPSVSILLLLSPGIFTIFWVADPNGAVRKEVFAYAGLSLVALGLLKKSPLPLWIGAILLSIGFVAHEAMLLFLPIVAASIWLSGAWRSFSYHHYGSIALMSGAAIFVVGYTLQNQKLADSQLLCQLLTARQLTSDICTGAVEWVGKDLSYAFERLLMRLKPLNMLAYFIGYSLSLLPFFYLIAKSDKAQTARAALILAALPFLLLNIIALDWGRWISFHSFSLCVLAVCAMHSGKLVIEQAIPTKALLRLCALALLISPSHVLGLRVGGALKSLVLAAL